MREVVLDTETTGLDPKSGHRIIEIGAVELVNHVATGEIFHCYVDPQRDVPAEAFAVHGLSTTFLTGKPLFGDVAGRLMDFIADSLLVIHNAAFDIGFLNAELLRIEREPIARERCVDTLEIARRNFPGAPASLDALCRRYQIDLSDRVQHGALKDARLLAAVYLELLGGREPALSLAPTRIRHLAGIDASAWIPRRIYPTAAENEAHREFLASIPGALWNAVEEQEEPQSAAATS
jgi:DNA polymerase-3 subunit epsilon